MKKLKKKKTQGGRREPLSAKSEEDRKEGENDAGLAPVLSNRDAALTVFAPENAAWDAVDLNDTRTVGNLLLFSVSLGQRSIPTIQQVRASGPSEINRFSKPLLRRSTQL